MTAPSIQQIPVILYYLFWLQWDVECCGSSSILGWYEWKESLEMIFFKYFRNMLKKCLLLRCVMCGVDMIKKFG